VPDNFAAVPKPVRDDAFIYSYSGSRIGLGHAPPSLEDIAVSLGRLCRFTGHCRIFYPVLLHSMAVSDLVHVENTRAALLHDAAEIYLSDIPTPFKAPEMKAIEMRLLMPIFSKYLDQYELLEWVGRGHELVKVADREVFTAEVHLLGCAGLRAWVGESYPDVEEKVQEYIDRYPIEECVRPDGKAVIEFIRRARQ